MRVSNNELHSLLKQALEGCGLAVGVYESAAKMLVWAMAHDLLHCLEAYGRKDWSERMQDTLQHCFERKMVEPEIVELGLSLECEEKNDLEFDAQDTSSLLWGSMIADLAISRSMANRSKGNSCYRVSVRRCFDRLLFAQQLIKIKNQGLLSLAVWRQNEALILLQSLRESDCPELRLFDATLDSTRILANNALLLFLSDDGGQIDDFVETLFGDCRPEPVVRIEPDEFKRCYGRSLDHGIDMSDELWCRLLELASNVLVESNEHSRKGAGA